MGYAITMVHGQLGNETTDMSTVRKEWYTEKATANLCWFQEEIVVSNILWWICPDDTTDWGIHGELNNDMQGILGKISSVHHGAAFGFLFKFF